MGKGNQKKKGKGGKGGGGRSNNQGGDSNKKKSSTPELKFDVQGPGKVIAQYATVQDVIVKYILKSYINGEDIVDSINNLAKMDMKSKAPTREISTETDKEKAKVDQDGLDIDYQDERQAWRERRDRFDSNWTRAFGLIYQNYCTKAMQQRIDQHPDFDSKINKNPVELLKAIKQLTRDPVRKRYPAASMTDALARFINPRQKADTDFMDHVTYMKQQRDVLKSHLGSHFLDSFVETTPEYTKLTDANEKQAMKDGMFDQWSAYILLRSCDQTKYGSLTKRFVTDYSLGKDICPKTFRDMTDALVQHPWDARPNTKQGDGNKSNKQKQQEEKPKPRSEKSFAQRKKGKGKGVQHRCHCCGDPGHYLPDCPKKDTLDEKKWFINRAISNYLQEENSEDDVADYGSSEDDDDSYRTSRSSRSHRSSRGSSRARRSGGSSRRSRDDRSVWSGLQVHQEGPSQEVGLKQSTKPYDYLKDVFVLDSGHTGQVQNKKKG